MADNRMYLMHRPSGKAVYLAKRLGWGWYKVPDDIKSRIEELFRLVESQEAEGEQDDFCIAMEAAKEDATLVEKNWRYISIPCIEENGVRTLEISPPAVAESNLP